MPGRSRSTQRASRAPGAAAFAPKITRPRLHRAIERRRLFERIDAATTAVIWVAAPPGAGKTTLLSSYLSSRQLREIWYQVDSGDADPATFFHYLGLAALRAGLAGSELPRLPGDSSVDVATFARGYFRQMFERLAKPTILILDNVQEALGTVFDTLLRELVSEVPEGVRIVAICLTDPPPSLARMLANRLIGVIDAEELRLTRDESREIVRAEIDLEGAAIDALHDRCGGWVAGLILMTEQVRRAHVSHAPPPATSHEAVFDYFAGEIFSRASPDERRVLMLSSLLPRMTVKLVDAACPNSDAEMLLESLHRRHLFTDRRAGTETYYQYHSLFREFLLERARTLLTGAERTEAAGRAALMLEAEGNVADAVSLYLGSQNWPAAARLVLLHAQSLYAQGRWRTLLDWTAPFPSEIRQSQPWLGFWEGACRVWIEPLAARATLEVAFDRFVGSGDRVGQVLAAGALCRATLLDADWAPLDRWISALAEVLDTDHGLPPRVLLTGLSRLVYAAFARQPQNPQLPRWAERAVDALGADVDCNESVMAGFSLMNYYAWTGSTAKSERLIRLIQPLLSHPDLAAVSMTYWTWAYANHVLRIGSPREALAQIDAALDLAQGHGLAIAAVIRRHRVGFLLTEGNLDAAQAELEALAYSPLVEPYHECRAWLSLLRGDHARAEEEAGTALDMARARGRMYYRIHDVFLLLQIAAQRGAFAQAACRLEEFRGLTAGIEGGVHRYQALLLEAYLALQRGDPTVCGKCLGAALAIAVEQRYTSHAAWCPPMMSRLYAEALRQGIGNTYVRGVIARHALLPGTPDIDDWPWPVRILCLGRLEVLRGGETLRFDGKAQRKPLELIKVLIALGGQQVPLDTAIDALWPSRSPGDGQKAFDITVHRLRALLGSDQAIRVADRRVSLNPDIVWTDVAALERTMAPLVPPIGATAPEIALLEAAAGSVMALYRGHFLGDEPLAAWNIAIRNRLAGRFQRFVQRLGEHWETHGRWSQAVDLYTRATELDPLAELFYRRQMACLHALGRHAEAIEIFRRCRQTLSIMLGVSPSDETEALYRKIAHL